MANRVARFVFLAVVFLLSASSLLAQISPSTGAIQGTVTDPQGAVVVGAKVVLTNTATGVRAEGTTQSDGTYIFPLILPGTYKVQIEVPGFRRVVLSGVIAEVTKITKANAKLELGQVATVVEVSGAAQTVDTRTATTGDVISGELIRSIPLPTRNFLGLLALQPGVAAPFGSPAALGRGTPELFVAGQRGTVNNFVLNGVDANNYGNNNFGNVPIPNPDAVQEFRVNTTLYDASQGRGSGGNINIVQRSGTSQFHGGAFEFYRSDLLNANDFFFNRNGVKKPTLLQNQFGGTIGGPVPGLKETFWFFSYQGWRQKNGVAGGISGKQPVLPATRDAASLAAAFSTTANPLTAAQIDPVAVKWLNRPGPYGGLLYPSGTGAALGQTGRFSFSKPSIFNEDQYNATFDREMFHNNRVAIRFFVANAPQLLPLGGGVSLGQGQNQPVKNWHAAASDTHIFTHNLLNEFRAGFTLNRSKSQGIETTTLSDIGMSRFNSAFFNGTPAVFFDSGIFSCCGISTNNDQASANLAYTIADTVSWTRSKHTLRGGIEFRRYHVNTFNNFASRGFLNFANFNKFLTGTPNDVFVGTGITDRGFRAFDVSWFVQDDYRVLRRLTLNLGLRYDFLGPSTDVKNRLGNFDPNLITAACRAAGGGNCLGAGFVSPEALGGTFGTPGVSRSTYFNVDKNNFGPRIGLAYDVLGNGRLAIRGGYGIYYIRTSNQTLLQLITAPPYFQLFRATGTDVIGNQALANPYPNLPTSDKFPILPIFPRFNGFSSTTATKPGTPLFVDPATGKPAPLITINPFDRELITPYNESWNLTVQYEFLKGWVAEAGYLGSRGIDLIAIRQRNQALLVNAANPGLGGLTVNSSRNASARVRIPGFASTGLNDTTSSGDSWYNAFVFSVRHPFSKGLQVKADYTFSKSLDTNSGAATQDLGNAGGNQLVDSGNKGRSIFDQTHRIVITYLWEIPGPKQGWASQVLGGWSLMGSTIFQSGFPFNVTSNGSAGLAGFDGSGLSRGDAVCSGDYTVPGNTSEVIDFYIRPGCFASPALLTNGATIANTNPQLGVGTQTFTVGGVNGDTTGGTLFGNAGRGILRAPFQQRWDFAVSKKFPLRRILGEQGNLEFRSEFFKLFNTPIFSAPSANIDSTSTFGKISSTTDTTGRVIQFALKLNF